MKNIGHTIGAVSRGVIDGTNGEGAGAGSGEGEGSEEFSCRSSIMHTSTCMSYKSMCA